MKTKDNLDIQVATICKSLTRLTNQVYKLLPLREEGEDWEKPLQTIVVEINGLFTLFPQYQDSFFLILCKLEGLHFLKEANDFFNFRRMIFDILTLINKVFADVSYDE